MCMCLAYVSLDVCSTSNIIISLVFMRLSNAQQFGGVPYLLHTLFWHQHIPCTIFHESFGRWLVKSEILSGEQNWIVCKRERERERETHFEWHLMKNSCFSVIQFDIMFKANQLATKILWNWIQIVHAIKQIKN